jgi:hypothetical protein
MLMAGVMKVFENITINVESMPPSRGHGSYKINFNKF